MTIYTALTVPTQFVEANGIRFAYRRWGKKGNLPLVFNQHFTGNLDNWDPAVLDGLAGEREIIIFNNAGIASSTGEVPTTFAGMAKNAEAFVDALGLKKIDLLGFSIGGMVAQQITVDRPELIRKLILLAPLLVITMPGTAKATLHQRPRPSLARPTTRLRIYGSRSFSRIRRRARLQAAHS